MLGGRAGGERRIPTFLGEEPLLMNLMVFEPSLGADMLKRKILECALFEYRIKTHILRMKCVMQV